MSTPVEQIKERLGIADVVGSYMQLIRAGSSLKGKCPFHNEKTPSFFVSPARNSYYCFGCQAKGDIFTFVQEFEGLDFIGALRVLAQRAGVTLTHIDPKVRSQYARLYLCLEKATRFYEETLRNTPEAKAYIEGRGLTQKTLQDWRVGFAPADWRQLFDHLTKEGFTPEEMGKVGLIKRPSADIGVVPTASGTSDIATSAGTNATGAASTSASGRSNALERRVFGIYFFAEFRKLQTLFDRVHFALLLMLGQERFDAKKAEYAALQDVLLLEAETSFGEGTPSAQEEAELLRHLEEEYLTTRLSETMDTLAKAEKDGKKEETQALLQKCKELTQKLAGLKSARFSH